MGFLFLTRRYELLEPLTLGFGSHTQHPTSKTRKTFKKGTILKLDDHAPNGNLWFVTPDGERGKTTGMITGMLNRKELRFEDPVVQEDYEAQIARGARYAC